MGELACSPSKAAIVDETGEYRCTKRVTDTISARLHKDGDVTFCIQNLQTEVCKEVVLHKDDVEYFVDELMGMME